MSHRNTTAYLRRYADAVTTLAEMAMVSHHGLHERRFVLFYDDNDEVWVVQRQWRDQDGQQREDDLARESDVADAVEAAHVRWREEGQT